LCELATAGFFPMYGVAGCRWIARLSARRGDSNGMALAVPRSYISRLPVSSLPISEQSARSLNLLGYKRIGDVAKVELDVLKSYFGEEAFEIKRDRKSTRLNSS